jgi:hypothetical protein
MEDIRRSEDGYTQSEQMAVDVAHTLYGTLKACQQSCPRDPTTMFPTEQVFLLRKELGGLCVTPTPEAIYFPGLSEEEVRQKNAYYVTSTAALRTNAIIPACMHPATHRGAALKITDRVFSALQIPTGLRSAFVWLYPPGSLDPQQIRIEQAIADDPERNRRLLFEAFCGGAYKRPDSWKLHPELKSLLRDIQENRKPEKTELNTQRINKIVTCLQQTQGLRGMYSTILEKALWHEIPRDSQRGLSTILMTLMDDIPTIIAKTPTPEKEVVVVLEVPIHTLFASEQPYPVVIAGARDPAYVVPAYRLPIFRCTSIYSVHKPDDRWGNWGSLYKPIDQIPADAWIQGLDREPITPEKIQDEAVDPQHPLCVVRSQTNMVEAFAKAIIDGQLLPYFRPDIFSDAESARYAPYDVINGVDADGKPIRKDVPTIFKTAVWYLAQDVGLVDYFRSQNIPEKEIEQKILALCRLAIGTSVPTYEAWRLRLDEETIEEMNLK